MAASRDDPVRELRFLSLANAPLDEADVVLLPVPYEHTVTYKKGTATAPAAILDASDQLECYEEDARWSPTLHMRVTVAAAVERQADEAERGFHDRLAAAAASLPGCALLIALGGEHSITPSLVSGRMAKSGTIVHIDAHADLRPSYQGSIYNHACPAYRLRQQGHRLLQIGIRSLTADEAERIAVDPAITTYFDRSLRHSDVWESLMGELATLAGPVWLTVDMDGLDPALTPGVGTPQPGGLSWHQMVDIFEVVLANAKVDVRGVDIVELLPEASRVSEMTAAKLVQKAMSFWGKGRGYDRRPRLGSQAQG